MTARNEVYRPLKVAGIFFVISSLVGVLFFNYIHVKEGLERSFVIFISINIIFHLILGIGILMQKMWGLYLLKIYLYLLVLGFPIGTYIGVKSLRYIRENKIEERLKTL
jgi:hypothetical protein